MIIEAVRVQNFRSVFDETLACDVLIALVGRNGSGKSSFLHALKLFYDQSSKIDVEDYYNRDTNKPVIITVTFKIISEDAKEQFAPYIQGDHLAVEKVFEWNDGRPIGTYHGSRLQNAEFTKVRVAGSATDQKPIYMAIQEKYGLQKWKTQGEALAAMKRWEEENADRCERCRDEGKFFGFASVGTGYLGKFTRYLFVPAVREASDDAQESKGSILSILMDLVVRSVIATKEAYTKLKKETQAQYEDIMNPENLPELQSLGEKITKTLQSFVPDSRLVLNWRNLAEVNIPMPQADAKLIEDEFEANVARTGHGLQRAFILTMLQHLTFAQTTISDSKEKEEEAKTIEAPNFVLAIEEPELYQHPSRQRHFADILSKLASGAIPGVSKITQVIYATHSPLFVGIDRIEHIRLIRKLPNGDGLPKATSVLRVSLDDLVQEVWEANGKPGDRYTGDTLLSRLKTIMTPWMNEGFFADVAVLVEGEDDRAVVLGFANAMGYQFDSMGICVIPCNGKTSIDRPAIIFRSLGIPIYAIWDNDETTKDETTKDAKPQDNHRLLRVFGKNVEDWPVFVSEQCACFKGALEKTLRSELGQEYYDKQLDMLRAALNISKTKDAIKNPLVFENLIKQAIDDGKNIPTLKRILENIIALKK